MADGKILIRKVKQLIKFEGGNEGDLTGLWHEDAKGIIEKSENGELTGVLYDAALALLRPFVPRNTYENIGQAFDAAIQTMVSEGITTYMDACVKPYLFEVYNTKYATNADGLPRGFLSIAFTHELIKKITLEANSKTSLSEIVKISENSKLTVNTVKFFMDGVYEDKTAYTHHHYCCVDHHGLKHFDEKELNHFAALLHKKGIRCHIHAIGEQAVRMALDALENAHEQNPGTPDPRHYIAHNQVVREVDYGRFLKYNILLSLIS